MKNENDRYKRDNGKIRHKKKWEKESESGNVRKQAARTRNFLKIKDMKYKGQGREQNYPGAKK